MKNLGFYRNLNYPIQLGFKEVVGLFDIFQLIAVGNQGSGVDFALFDEVQDFGAVAAVYAAGFEGEVFAVHVGQGKGLGFVVEGHHGDDGIGPGAGPGQTEGVLWPATSSTTSAPPWSEFARVNASHSSGVHVSTSG